MRISGLTTHLVRLDPRAWYGDAEIPREERTEWLHPISVFHTDDGIDGHVSGSGTNGEGRVQAHALHDVYFPGLAGGDPLDRLGVWTTAMSTTRHVYPLSDAVVGLIDVAMWDLAGKALGTSVANLIGGGRSSMPTYRTGSHWNRRPEDTFDEVQRLRARGHHGYKLTLGHGLDRDASFLHAAREAAGPGFPLMLDAVGRYGYDEALRVGRLLDELSFHWFEEPIPDRHRMLLEQLSRRLRTPVLTGETVRLQEAADAIVGSTTQRVRGDVQLKAGVTGLLQLTSLAASVGIAVELHACSSSLLDIANLHVGCATGCCELFESHHPLFRFGLVGDPLEPDEQGFLHLPTGPGLGVELDWDWIDDHTVEVLDTGPG